MSKPVPIKLKEYIVIKRFEPIDAPGFEAEYKIICEVPLLAPAYEFNAKTVKIGHAITKTGANGVEYQCTILKPKILQCGAFGAPVDVIQLFLTDSVITPELASSPPVMYRGDIDTQKIGVLLIATGKYYKYVDELINGAQKHLFAGHTLTFFVFTNHADKIKITDKNAKVEFIDWEHKSWPGATLYRYKAFTLYKHKLEKMDYLYYCDVDMKFVGSVGNEALGKLVGILHPGFADKPNREGTPERNPKSKAYIPVGTKNKYYAGGFNGGSAAEFLRMSEMLDERIDEDDTHKIVAQHHDESHMNWYFLHCPPTISLDPGYCYPEKAKLSYTKRLLALDKNHKEMRS